MKPSKLLRDATMAYRTLIKRETPTIIYAPGRVGSIAMTNAIREAGVLAYKVEFFDIENTPSVKFCRKNIIETGRPASIITIVRDPMEILLSLYFSKRNRGRIPLTSDNELSTLRQDFTKHMLEQPTYHDMYLRWVETEFEHYLGFSLFDHQFDTAVKHTRIKHERFSTLIFRLDLPDEEKSRVISDFVGQPVSIMRVNTKDTDTLYQAFKADPQLPQEKIEWLYSLPYSQHFFSSDERAEMKKRWSKN